VSPKEVNSLARTHIEELIDRSLAGETAQSLVSEVQEQTLPQALKLRKQLRSESPKLYQHLSGRGTLHDFALDLHKMKAKALISKYEIPKELLKELDKFV
jgi:hypothetical protein